MYVTGTYSSFSIPINTKNNKVNFIINFKYSIFSQSMSNSIKIFIFFFKEIPLEMYGGRLLLGKYLHFWDQEIILVFKCVYYHHRDAVVAMARCHYFQARNLCLLVFCSLSLVVIFVCCCFALGKIPSIQPTNQTDVNNLTFCCD